MKICVLTHTFPRFPGDPNAPFVKSLSKSIARLGHRVEVITAFDPQFVLPDDRAELPVHLYRYIYPDRLHILAYSRTIEGNIRFRRRVFFMSPLLILFGFLKTLKIAHSMKADIIHAHWILPNGFIGALVSYILNIPLVITLHGSDVFTAEKNRLFSFMASVAARRASWMTTPSPDHFQRLQALGVSTKRMELVPNGTDPDTFRPSKELRKKVRSRLGIKEKDIVVFALGRMVYVKGFDILIRAYAKVSERNPKISIIVGGHGVQKDEWMTLASELGLEGKIIWPGELNRSEVAGFFAAADMLVVPSIKHPSGAVDGLPVVVPEAMSSGIPVIGSDVGGIPVFARDGERGIIVPQKDEEALTEAIMKLAADKSLRRRLGENGRKFIMEKCNWNVLAEHFDDIFRSAHENKTGPSKPFLQESVT